MATRKVPPQPGGALGEPAATPAPPPPGVPAPPADPSVHRSFGPVERRILGALHARDLPALERLLLYPDLNVHQRNLGRAALLLAVRAGWAHVVRQLMRLGVDPNRPLRPQDCRNTGLTDLLEDAERGILPLLAAAQTGRADIIAALVDEGGADVNARTADGWTALEAAAYAKHDAAVRALVDRGATSVGAGPATGTDGGGIGWGDADEADGDYEEDGMAPVPSVPSSAIPTPAGSISAIFDTPPPATPDPTVPPRAASHLAADANIDVPRVDSLNPAISPRSASLPSDPTPPSSATLPFAAGSLAPSLAESSIPLKPGAPGIVVVPPTLEREFPDEEGRYPPGSAHGALVEARRALQEEEERARGESSAAATGNAEASRAELAAARAAARMASSESLPAAAPSPVEVAPPQQDDAVARAELAAARAAARMAGSEDYLPASPSPAECLRRCRTRRFRGRNWPLRGLLRGWRAARACLPRRRSPWKCPHQHRTKRFRAPSWLPRGLLRGWPAARACRRRNQSRCPPLHRTLRRLPGRNWPLRGRRRGWPAAKVCRPRNPARPRCPLRCRMTRRTRRFRGRNLRQPGRQRGWPAARAYRLRNPAPQMCRRPFQTRRFRGPSWLP
ncbi:hypothetical protein DFJ74DRAFT_43757 [Hyaloraphidium curvatum]|nr:hypothetical protein DFJ74DRAFT_43757 [Hyaloraphidium curvatum]